MNTLVRQLEIEREKEIEQEEIKKAKSSPFKKFYQVNKEMTKERLWLIGILEHIRYLYLWNLKWIIIML